MPNDIVAEIQTRTVVRSRVRDEDNSVFSDVVQDAFRKYQNEVGFTKEIIKKNNLFIFELYISNSGNIYYIIYGIIMVALEIKSSGKKAKIYFLGLP